MGVEGGGGGVTTFVWETEPAWMNSLPKGGGIEGNRKLVLTAGHILGLWTMWNWSYGG